MGENVQSKKSTKIQFNNKKNPNHTKFWKNVTNFQGRTTNPLKSYDTCIPSQSSNRRHVYKRLVHDANRIYDIVESVECSEYFVYCFRRVFVSTSYLSRTRPGLEGMGKAPRWGVGGEKPNVYPKYINSTCEFRGCRLFLLLIRRRHVIVIDLHIQNFV